MRVKLYLLRYDRHYRRHPHHCLKGLRHGFGVKAATDTRNPRLVQKWLGHRYLETTTIYMDAVGAEERELAARMWG